MLGGFETVRFGVITGDSGRCAEKSFGNKRPIADACSWRQHSLMIAAILLLAVATPVQSCELENVTSARELHDVLAHRAVSLVVAASTKTGSSIDPKLSRLLDSAAEFSLGGGDVGRLLGTGIIGAKALAATMKATEFRYFGWDYMDGPTRGCAEQEVSIEFIDANDHRVSQVQFKFKDGRVIEAKGWQRSFKMGTLPPQPLNESGS